MDIPSFIVQFATDHPMWILTAFLVSEILGNVPSVKENSVFQIVVKLLTTLKDAILKPVTPVAPSSTANKPTPTP